MDWFWYVFLLILLFGGGGSAYVRQLLNDRQRHRLEMKKQELKIAEANARAAEATTKRQALDVRSAELEIERFDRRMGTTGLPATPRLTSGVEPDLLRQIADLDSQEPERVRDNTDPPNKKE